MLEGRGKAREVGLEIPKGLWNLRASIWGRKVRDGEMGGTGARDLACLGMEAMKGAGKVERGLGRRGSRRGVVKGKGGERCLGAGKLSEGGGRCPDPLGSGEVGSQSGR